MRPDRIVIISAKLTHLMHNYR